MDRDHAIGILASHADEIRARGVASLALFGSVARGDQRPESDIDIMIDLVPGSGVSLLDFISLQRYLEEILHTRVDLVTRNDLHPDLRSNILHDTKDVF